jgi:phosphoribosylamine--glycine ligase
MDCDLADAFNHVLRGTLDKARVDWKPGAAVCVVLASGGYPGGFETGKLISGLDQVVSGDDVAVFHAGTKRVGNEYYTSGGRVLGVTATGSDVQAARAVTYDVCSTMSFDGVHYRRDIGGSAPMRGESAGG